jgi:hypothetical protein
MVSLAKNARSIGAPGDYPRGLEDRRYGSTYTLPVLPGGARTGSPPPPATYPIIRVLFFQLVFFVREPIQFLHDVYWLLRCF